MVQPGAVPDVDMRRDSRSVLLVTAISSHTRLGTRPCVIQPSSHVSSQAESLCILHLRAGLDTGDGRLGQRIFVHFRISACKQHPNSDVVTCSAVVAWHESSGKGTDFGTEKVLEGTQRQGRCCLGIAVYRCMLKGILK